jgi:hypothetical protein
VRHLTSLFCALCALCANTHAQPSPGRFSFGVIGDMPYFRFERESARHIVQAMNERELAFVIHVGDLKGGGDPCTDDAYTWNFELFESSRHALIYVPGDNDWTDCHRAAAGGYDPEERLHRLREIFYADALSLGQRKRRLQRQSDDARYLAYRENVRWQQEAVLFVTLNVTGSNNNFGRSAQADLEHHRRNAANIAWLTQSFELASRRLMRAVVVVIHANPLFELPQTERVRRGYNDFLKHLQAETIAFGKPVLLIHGDTHNHRVDQPMIDLKSARAVANFTRVESFGTPFLGWVRVTVDPAAPQLFSFEVNRYRGQVQEVQ